MKHSTISLLLSPSLATVFAQATSAPPGYTCQPHCIASTVPSNETSTLSFGTNFAVLNLDLINGIFGPVANTSAGQAFTSSVCKWIDAVHAKKPTPLTIFTRVYYTNARKPEIGPNTPFAKAGGALGTSSDPLTKIYPAFNVEPDDVVLQKTRYYAGAGNGLEEILSSQEIDTVILSGVRTSGVILNTVYQLFNLNYKVYVIANNTIESPPDGNNINTAILEGIIPKLPANVITLDQALAALSRSGPAHWGMMDM